MALFDNLTRETANQFELGAEQSSSLLTALLGFIEDETRGGLAGFVDLFRRAGLGDVAESWVARGANAALSVQQTTDALGADALTGLARAANVPENQAIPALSFMIPAVVDNLTPDGVTPMRTRAAAVPLTDAGGGSLLRWILPLLIVGLLVYLAILFLTRPNVPINLANANRAVNADANRAAANANAANSNVLAVVVPNERRLISPRVSVRAEGGKYFVSGVVSSEDERRRIIEALTAQFGAANLDLGGLTVNADAEQIAWLPQFIELLPSLKGWTGGELTFEGANTLRAVGTIPQTAIAKIKALFPTWTLPAIFLGTGAEAQKAANEQAAQALATAKTPAEVVAALNLDIINFASGKADIPPANQEILKKAAEVLKTAPAGTNIEIGGHTDNTGDKAKNQKLSEDRARAVKTALESLGVNPASLTAKGYGDTAPKADNKTKEGQFQNRRIEYKIN